MYGNEDMTSHEAIEEMYGPPPAAPEAPDYDDVRMAAEHEYEADQWKASLECFRYRECYECGAREIEPYQEWIADRHNHGMEFPTECTCGEETDGWDPQPPEWREREAWMIRDESCGNSALQRSEYNAGPHPYEEAARAELDRVTEDLEDINREHMHEAGQRAVDEARREHEADMAGYEDDDDDAPPAGEQFYLHHIRNDAGEAAAEEARGILADLGFEY